MSSEYSENFGLLPALVWKLRMFEWRGAFTNKLLLLQIFTKLHKIAFQVNLNQTLCIAITQSLPTILKNFDFNASQFKNNEFLKGPAAFIGTELYPVKTKITIEAYLRKLSASFKTSVFWRW